MISVNVSRVNLYNPDFLESLVNLVEKYKIPPKYLNLELTESAFSDDARMIQNAVDYLHKAGFTILMDDFGSGYSSLNVLKDIDIDVLKIDMRFLSKGSSEERGEKILEAVIKMAKSLDMLVIAEGVDALENEKCKSAKSNHLISIVFPPYHNFFKCPLEISSFISVSFIFPYNSFISKTTYICSFPYPPRFH